MGPALNLTQSGVTMGTPLYMSPEQVEGKPLDQRTDIYSFGVTCYHMLAGQPPFRGQSAFEVALQHVRAEPAALSLLRPDLPPGLARIVHKMMAKKTEERYQNFRELLQDLNRLGEEASATGQQEGNLQTPIIPIPINGDSLAMATATSPTSPPQPATLTILTVQAKPTAGHARRRGLLATAILVALLIGAGAAWWRLHPASPKTASPPASGDVGEVNALFSESELEKFLIRAVDKYANPEGDPNQIRLGIGHCTELLVFYLERHRLDEADRFLDRLDNPGQKVRPYKALGRLGHAIVLALQDRPEESNQLFLQLLKETKNERDRFLQGFWFTQNPSLRFWVARALDYNKENTTSKHPFPVQLEFLRRPTVLPPFPPPRRLPGERRQGD
jgi:serine/threonine-protein kinase